MHEVHKLSNHQLYGIWSRMKSKNKESVCDEWKKSFVIFYEWAIKSGWNRNFSMERINTELPFSPTNCRFFKRYDYHGMTDHPLFRLWSSMRCRCNKETAANFGYYGKRGVKVCDEWNYSSETFINWALKNGWKAGLQLDRINNDGNYEPSNCRFVTPSENQRNKGKISKRLKNSGLPIGVSKNKKRFSAHIGVDGHQIHLGTFDTPERASEIYQKAVEFRQEEKKLRGIYTPSQLIDKSFVSQIRGA